MRLIVKSMPSSGMSSFELNTRMATSSLYPAVGIVATRNSISLSPGSLYRIFPSCGLRRSEISRLAMILKRDTMARRYVGGMVMYLKHGTVHPKSDNRFFLIRIGLDMYV